MTDITAYLWVTAGVICAVLLPMLSAQIRREFPPVAGVTVPPWIRRYLLLLIFSLIAALACLAIWRSGNPNTEIHWFTAFLIGFGFESAFEKFFHPTP
jgi:hypothetical protein